jgi:hypothetical protein
VRRFTISRSQCPHYDNSKRIGKLCHDEQACCPERADNIINAPKDILEARCAALATLPNDNPTCVMSTNPWASVIDGAERGTRSTLFFANH